MQKKATEEKSVAVVNQSPVALSPALDIPADMMSELVADAEARLGFENVTADDMSIPFLTILQNGSPQVRGTGAVDGAEEGDLFNTVTGKVYKGPVEIIPCAFHKSWVEWVPREAGGGFVAHHDSDTILQSCTKDEKGKYTLPNGNQIVETAYHLSVLVTRNEAGQIAGLERVVLGLTSSQLRQSRKWLAMQKAITINVGGRIINPPAMSHSYTLTTEVETKDKYMWYGLRFSNPRMVDSRDSYAYAKAFNADADSKKVTIAPPVAEGEVVPADDNNSVL